MTIYTPDVSMGLKALPQPVDMTVDIVDYGRYLGIRFYEADWHYLSENERYKMGAYFELVRRYLKSKGIDSTLDPVFNAPPGVQQLK
jgi:hypothetical protein